jgi:hypothetical protein
VYCDSFLAPTKQYFVGFGTAIPWIWDSSFRIVLVAGIACQNIQLCRSSMAAISLESMALGFPASFTEEIAVVGSRESVCDAIVGAFDALGWRYVQNEFRDYVVHVPMSGFSWGETLTVALADRCVLVESVCRWPLQVVDWGKNNRNVEQFTSIFSIRQIREARFGDQAPMYLDADGRTPLDRAIGDEELLPEHNDAA